MSEIRFDERVAIVTGAGNGLGRQHSLLLASLGAKVVVNDLGGGAHGDGESSAAADRVVQEIHELGGEAVANYDSVENGETIVQTALDAFGTVDIVINNAGILRDTSFAKMSQSDWDLILSVHLSGSKSVTQAAWPIMREKGYGRIIMTTSAAGIYGNFGQANYCAAKLGLHGLAQCLAEEGRSKGIHVNTIAPIAASRLTETILPPEILDNLKPENVSPLVAWLCHEDCPETKGLFEVGAGYFAKLRWERTLGHSFPLGRAFSVGDVVRKWDKISDFNGAEHPSNTNEALAPVFGNISHPSLGGNEFIDLDEASQGELVLESSYDERDLALYALGIGAARDPHDRSELNYVYELGSDFQALPTYAVMPQSGAMLSAAKTGAFTLPGMNFGFERLLHGEQYTEIHRPLPPHAKLKHVFKFKEAFDKAPNAVVTFAISSLDEEGNEVAYNEMTSFVKGAGGWGGERGPSGDINMAPDRSPDAVIQEKTDENQTLLYRLSGDWNPLHVDQNFAEALGFEKPILHGLCTFGYCGRHVIKAFSNNDPRYFKSIKVRFAKSVFPGDTLETRMWKESDTRILFETRVKERDEVVIKNAVVELFAEIPAEKPKNKAASQAEEGASSDRNKAEQVDNDVTLEDIFAAVSQYIASKPELVDQTKTSFQFQFSNPESSWFIDLKSNAGHADQGVLDKPDVTIALDSKHIDTLFGGDINQIQQLFFSGEMKIHGNVMASNKLVVLAEMDPRLVEEARAKRVVSGGDKQLFSGMPNGHLKQDDRVTIADIFSAVAEYIVGKPELVDQTKTSFQFHFTHPESSWYIDLKDGAGQAAVGTLDKPDVSIEMDTQYVDTLFGGDLAEVQKLFFGGQMKISGNVMASNKLAVLSGMPKTLAESVRDNRLKEGVASNTGDKPDLDAFREPVAPTFFAALADQMNQGAFSFSGQPILQFRLTAPDSDWILDFSSSPPVVKAGVANEADAEFLLSDEDLGACAEGEHSIKSLYQQGRLAVRGDMQLAHELQQLQGLA